MLDGGGGSVRAGEGVLGSADLVLFGAEEFETCKHDGKG